MKTSPVKNILKNIIIALLIICGVFLLFTYIIIPQIKKSAVEIENFHTHYALDPEEPQLIYGGEWLREEKPLVEYRGGLPRVYLSAKFLREYIDPFIFWDKGAEILFISTPYEMLEFTPDSEIFLVNGTPQPIENGIVERSGEIYIPISVIHGLYPFIIDFNEQHNMVAVTNATEQQTTAIISAESVYVHYWADSRPVLEQLFQGQQVVIFPEENESGFVRIRTNNGLLGYVKVDAINNINTFTPIDNLRRNTILERGFIDNNTHPEKIWQGDKVNLIWEYAANLTANNNNMQTPLHGSVNVVSPTWFRLDESGMHINSVASREYVDWAHSQGVEVWALVFDEAHARSRAFLMNREARQHVVKQLVDFADTLNLDGINIDFENLLNAEEGPYKIQFLRELAIPMRERGVVLSAAVKVPMPFSGFYRRDLIAKTVDFVMVMAYDEHWSTSETAGPNASLPWVRDAVENMLRDSFSEKPIPPDRIVLGLPFYNRVWRTNVSTGEVSHDRAIGTLSTREFFEERNGEFVWDSNLGLYVGEASAFEDGETVIFRVWLECRRSLQEKLNVYRENNLAGVAAWNRIFAIDEFWDVLGAEFGN